MLILDRLYIPGMYSRPSLVCQNLPLALATEWDHLNDSCITSSPLAAAPAKYLRLFRQSRLSFALEENVQARILESRRIDTDGFAEKSLELWNRVFMFLISIAKLTLCFRLSWEGLASLISDLSWISPSSSTFCRPSFSLRPRTTYREHQYSTRDDSHDVLSQGACLFRANETSTPHSLTRTKDSNEQVLLTHSFGCKRQGKCDR